MYRETDSDSVTTATKGTTIRINQEGPVTIEAPDAESAIKALRGLFKGESSLKGELTVEETKPEDWQQQEFAASAAKDILQSLAAIQQSIVLLRQEQEESDAPETKEGKE